ncbi:MAG TPA: CueP family metal-binding protein [Anaerolineaceae bacterium]|nr:CueP family metal-binding protein [Anaerolineaceae bacterium]
MRKSQVLIIVGAILIAVTTVGIFALNKAFNRSENAFLEEYGLSGLTIPEIVQQLDSTTSDPAGLKASITSKHLVLMDDLAEVRLALPDDTFYLSFAPYITQTHPCAIHSLASCQGELVNREIYAVITDSNGKEIVSSNFTTMENGFVGVWLPRDINATLTVSYNGLVAQAPIRTYSGSDTCLTTPLRLN